MYIGTFTSICISSNSVVTICINEKFILFLSLICSPGITIAQYKNNVFVDIDYNGSSGASATYNIRLKEHLGIGAGAQVFQRDNSTNTALFADLRKYRIKNKHAWLFFVDLGFDFFKDDPRSGYLRADNAVYAGVGYGYLRAVTPKGSGVYATLRVGTDSRILHTQIPNRKDGESFNLDGTPVLAVGFKF
jgi:hypothetical protein